MTAHSHAVNLCVPPCVPALRAGLLQDWGVTQLCFEYDTEPYAKER